MRRHLFPSACVGGLMLAFTSGTASGCNVETCSSSDLSDFHVIEGPDSVAYRITASAALVDSVGGGYQGSVTNMDMDEDGRVVFHRFLEAPSRDDLPEAGQVLGERVLPRRTTRTFSAPIHDEDGYWVQIGDSEYGDPSLDEWFVIEVTSPTMVELELHATVLPCAKGNEEPGTDGVQWEQVW